MYVAWKALLMKQGRCAEVAHIVAKKQVEKHLAPDMVWVGGKKMKALEAVNGKKTAIGVILTFLVLVGPEVHKLAVDLGVTQEGLAYVTAGIAVIGAAHKAWKKFYGTN